MKRESLIKYCKENDIFVPKDGSKSYLESAVVRHFLDKSGTTVEGLECFGFWENENSDCMVCDMEKGCRSTSVGMDFDKYMNAVDRKTDKKIRF